VSLEKENKEKAPTDEFNNQYEGTLFFTTYINEKNL
jgi:hypothetical protein